MLLTTPATRNFPGEWGSVWASRRLASSVAFDWMRAAVAKVDELAELLRRNIQKGIALDAYVLEMRALAGA